MASRKLRGLTVEIGGNTTNLQKALREVEQRAKETQNSLKTIKSALKLNPNDTALQSSYMSTLQKQIEQTKEKLELLKQADKNAKQQLAKGEISSDEYAQLQKEIGLATKELDKLETEFRNAPAVIKQSNVAIRQFGEELQSIGDKTQEISKKAQTVGNNLSKFITIPIAGVATASVATGLEFEKQMNRVSAISGATGKEFEKLKEQAIDLGASTVFSAGEVADAQEQLASAGFAVNEILEAMPGVMDLAAVSGGDMALAAEAAGAAINQFGLEMSDASHVADIYAKAAADTNAETSDMAEAMKYAGPIASQLGLSVEDTAASIGIMSDAGIKGSQAGTTLRGALTRLGKPTKQSAQLMETLGIEVFDAQGKMKPFSNVLSILKDKFSTLSEEQQVQAVTTIFGQESMSGMLKLIDGAGSSFDNLRDGLKDSTGAAREMAETINAGASGSIEELKGSLETLGINVSEALAPALIQVTEFLQSLVDRFNELSPEQQQAVVDFGLVAAAIGPVISVTSKVAEKIGGLIKGVGSLVTQMAGAPEGMSGFAKFLKGLASPKGLISLAIAAVGSLGFAIYNAVRDSTEHIRRLNDITSELDENLNDVKGKSALIDSLVGELQKLNAVEDKSVDQQARIKSIIAQLNELLPEHQLEWDETTQSVKGLNDEYLNYIDTVKKEAVWEAQSNAIKQFTEEIVNAQGELFDAKEKFTQIMTEDLNFTKEQIQTVFDTIESGSDWDKMMNTEQFNSVSGNIAQTLYKNAQRYAGEYQKTSETVSIANTKISESTEKANAVLQAVTGDSTASLEQLASKSEESAERQNIAQDSKTQKVTENTAKEQEVKQQASEADAVRNQQDIEGLQARNEAIEEATSQLEASYKNHLDALNAVQSEGFESSKVTLDEYLASMRERQEQQHAFEQNMQQLRLSLIETGNADLLGNLEQFNVSHAGLVQELVDSDDAKFNELVEIWRTNSKVAGESATSELNNALEEFGPIMDEVLANLELENPEFAAKAKGWMDNIKAQIDANAQEPANAIKASNEQTKSALADISSTANSEGKKVGTETASGINEEKSALNATKQMNLSIQAVYKKIADQAFKSGTGIPLQISSGIASNQPQAERTTRNLVNSINSMLSGLSSTSYSNGVNVVNGVVNGIYSGTGRAYNAGANLAYNVNAGFRRNLDINSPSGVMIENMGYVIEGLEVETKRSKGRVDKLGSDLANSLNTGFTDNVEMDFNAKLDALKDLNTNANVELGFGSFEGLKEAISGNGINYEKLGDELAKSLARQNVEPKQPVEFVISTPGHAWRAYVDDITKAQSQSAKLELVY